MNNTEEFYNKYGEKYHDLRVSRGKLFNEYIEMPAVLELLKTENGYKTILDVGCGSGIYAKILSQEGFFVEGIDSSKKMIDLANRYCTHTNAKFFHSSFENYSITRKYDIVLGSFILGYFKDLDILFSKARNLLLPNGMVVITGIHPIRESSTIRGNESYIINNYFELNNYESIIIDDIEPLKLAKHTFSEISQSANRNDFNIQLILEPKPVFRTINYHGNKDVEFFNRNPSIVIFKLKLNNYGK